jgi:hypothetical protein
MAQVSARIQQIMRLAEEEAAELKAHAEAETAAKIARADQDIADLRARADDQIMGLRARASRETKALLEHARQQCDQLEAESAVRRETAEQDATRAIAQRESAASAQIREGELRSIARIHLMLRVVGEQLATRARAVERDESALHELRAQVAGELTGLETLRTDITAALAATHQLLAEALGQVCGAPVGSATVGGSDGPTPPPSMPMQRSAEGGTVYLLNAGTEDRSLPRTPR